MKNEIDEYSKVINLELEEFWAENLEDIDYHFYGNSGYPHHGYQTHGEMYEVNEFKHPLLDIEKFHSDNNVESSPTAKSPIRSDKRQLDVDGF